MSCKVLKRTPVNKKQELTSDQIIQVIQSGKPLKLLRIGYRDPETRIHYVYFITIFYPKLNLAYDEKALPPIIGGTCQRFLEIHPQNAEDGIAVRGFAEFPGIAQGEAGIP
ncbi:hypothetical protein ADUPG1_001316 [Aduncisulcus paluster]|uniref:Ribulose-bisphosphate carboxylase n=1 Tax=Aduncisulcus paluster TaxID=2918883 RepID=A0ABQ5KBN5_9EUKA|nr:hypothetical protein ADUPG1_001316 [Aduncisulcus paluster]